MATEYRIEFTIQRQQDGEADFTDVGFGSSGGSTDLDACVHMLSSQVQNRIWETEPGMPKPKELEG